MKKTIAILTVFALSSLWGQKEIPIYVDGNEETASERVSGYQANSIDPEMIQQIRTFKATKEKMHIKKEMMNGTPIGSKSFKASNSESKFLAIKKIIDQIKDDNQNTSIEIIKSNNKVTSSRELNRTINYKKGNDSN
mgnify:CR=1 FL=1